MRKPLLGRTTVHVPCQCCNDGRVEPKVARAREKRQWKRELRTGEHDHHTEETPC